MAFPPDDTSLGRLRILEVWDEYDGPRLFVAVNASATLFVAFWADQTDDVDTWLYVAVSEARLERVQSGSITLRDAFTTAEDGNVFVVRVPRKERDGQSLVEAVRAAAIDLDLLPPGDDRLAADEPIILPAIQSPLTTHWLRISRVVAGLPVHLDAVTDVLRLWRQLFNDVLSQLKISAELVPLATAEGSFKVALGIAHPEVANRVIALLSNVLESDLQSSLFGHRGDLALDFDHVAALLSTLSEHKIRLEVLVEGEPPLQISPLARPNLARIIDQAAVDQRLETDEVPQADDLNRVFRVLDLYERLEPVNPDTLEVVPRQVSYYKHACRVLGYLDVNGQLTSAGRQVVRLASDHRLATTAVQFEQSACGYEWLRWSNGRSLVDLKPGSAEQFLSERSKLRVSTVRRRAQTLRAWYDTLVPFHYLASSSSNQRVT